MGRPYAVEMAQLPRTYSWALGADIENLIAGVRYASTRPLVAVGSGGSLTAAHLAADLHQRYARQLARVMTPYEVVAFGGPPPGAAVIMFSAGGKNADIRGALDVCLAAEPEVLVLVTGAAGSPAARTARAARFPHVVTVDLPAGRDGFLATNSLLAFATLTTRAYACLRGASSDVPPTWDSLTGGDTLAPQEALLEALSGAAGVKAPGGPRTLVTLYGLDTRAAAIDLESKCTEAALAVVQLADYRNFAHGRHHWLAKYAAAVVTLESTADLRIAERTLAQLPTGQRVARVRMRHDGAAGALEGLVRAMHLAGALGTSAGIDPGRPGVPDFGGKLYSLRVIAHAAPRADPLASAGMSDAERLAIQRKTRRDPDVLEQSGTLSVWRTAYVGARASLERTRFGAVVFDYDGTLVDGPDRFSGPRDEVAVALESILRAGVPVGIATGRGRSAGTELRDRLGRDLWERVLIGYYNGGDIALLADDQAPDGTPHVCEALRPAFAILSTHSILCEMAELTPRRPQLTIEARDVRFADDVWRLVCSALVGEAGRAVRVMRSSHSIDILPLDVSKGQLVRAVRERFAVPDGCAILTVGDRGQWPGNDAEMLASLDAVSVDQASADPGHAWCWAPPGVRGVAATLSICERLQFASAGSGGVATATFRVSLNNSSSVTGGEVSVGEYAPRAKREAKTRPKAPQTREGRGGR